MWPTGGRDGWLGPVLEDRFKQEDRLVKALQVVESLSAQRV